MPTPHSNRQPFCASRHPTNSPSTLKHHTFSWLPHPGARTSASRKAFCPSLSCEHLRQLKSKHQFAPIPMELLNNLAQLGTNVAQWANYKWNMELREKTSQLHSFTADVSALTSGMFFHRPAWIKLHRLQTGVRLFRSTMHKWAMAPTVACECSAREQTTKRVITSFPIQLELVFSRLLTGATVGALADRHMSGHLVDCALNIFSNQKP